MTSHDHSGVPNASMSGTPSRLTLTTANGYRLAATHYTSALTRRLGNKTKPGRVGT